MKAIVKWGLWQRRWSTLFWSLGVIFFVFINLIFYPSFKNQSAEYEKLFAQMPESAKALISDTGDFLSPAGYLSSQVFYLMLPLLLGILAISIGVSIIGKEEREGTIELLLSRPISRVKLLAGKALVGLAIVGGVGLVAALAVAVISKLVELEVPFANIFLAGFSTLVLVISFGAVGFAASCLGRGGRTVAIAVATFYAFGGYILASLVDVAEWLKWPSKAFPFNYYQPGAVLEGTYNWANMLFMLGVIVVAGLVSWWAFARRDLVNN